MLSQLLVNGVIAGSIYALVASGFGLIFRVVRFFHFTHELTYSFAPYIAFGLHAWLHVPILQAIALAVMGAALMGFLLDVAVFAPLRAREASALVSLLASIGLYVVGQNFLSVTFGDGARSLRPYIVVPGIEFLGARITPPLCQYE